jgi:hypothetical protein
MKTEKETHMNIKHMPIGELVLLVGTRAMLGAGVGLLMSEHLGENQRKATGWILLLVGLVTSLPLGLDIFGGSGPHHVQTSSDNER